MGLEGENSTDVGCKRRNKQQFGATEGGWIRARMPRLGLMSSRLGATSSPPDFLLFAVTSAGLTHDDSIGPVGV